ncbi:hypothetical protein MJO29_008269 [Puccinia striiformis f. sp. tritici]|nr:hypothetical protein MJO29_008269 [Puccinia striiformis f. sp. tritici]
MADIEVIGTPKVPQITTTTATTSTSPSPSPSTPTQKSWVWSHFKLLVDEGKVQCQFPDKQKNGDPCDVKLNRDPTGSTKSMGEHLKRLHKSFPPGKEKTNQLLLPGLLKRQRIEQRPILTANLLKQAITYLIAEADLSYSIVEHKSFSYLLELLNPSTVNMEFGRKTMASEVEKLYFGHRKQLERTLKGIKHLAFTLDAWTSPNQKAFMAITAHGITSDYKMLDVLIGMPTVHGQHTGENFGNIFVDLIDKMEISNFVVSITADNASNNSTLARRVKQRLGSDIFDADTQLLGCMAHVINLAAHDGLRLLGASPTAPPPFQVDLPDGAGINLQTIVSRIHGLSTYVRGSPQRRQAFFKAMEFVNSQGGNSANSNKMLKLDVHTRWNSTYLMLKRAIELKRVCTTYCSSNLSQSQAARYSLSDDEWEKVAQITNFLEPLYDVTQILC